MNTMLPNNITESGEIKALQRGHRIAQELKNNAEAVFVQACNAVKVAETHAADNEIVIAAIKKVHKSAQSSFFKARQTVDDFEISLKTVTLIDDDDVVELVSDCQRTMKGKMSIPKDDTNKPAAVPAPSGQKTNTAEVATNAKRVYPEEMATLNIHNSIQIADWFNEAIDKSNWALDEQDESVLDQSKAPTAVPKEFAGIAAKKIYPEAMAVQHICDSAKDAKDWLDEELGTWNSPTIVQVHDKISDIANPFSKEQTTKKRAAEGKSNAGDDGKKQGAKLCSKKSKKASSGSLELPQELDGRECSVSELTLALIEHQDSVFKLLTASAARGEQVVPYCSMFSARRATMSKLKLINSSIKIFTGKSISEIELSEKMENSESAAMKQCEEYRIRKNEQEEWAQVHDSLLCI